jgi:hypothetical protein
MHIILNAVNFDLKIEQSNHFTLRDGLQTIFAIDKLLIMKLLIIGSFYIKYPSIFSRNF